MPNQPMTSFWQTVRANHNLQRQTRIAPAPRDMPMPLSFGQARLWALDRMHPGNVAHNLRAVYHLQGPLDVAALERSLQTIIERHEILRTTFTVVDDQPIQVVHTAHTLDLPVIDIPATERDEQLKQWATTEGQQSFDLNTGPLLRLTLLRFATDDHVLIRTLHHIISDRWSDSVFLRELASLYEAFTAGTSPDLPEMSLQYADFAYFQRQNDIPAPTVDFWREQLSGAPAPMQLPVDKSLSTAPTYAGNTLYLTLAPALVEALKALSQQEGVSLYVTLLTAFKSLLYQYSGQEDMVIVSPIAGRNRIELRKLMGYFNNVVLIRSNLRENTSLRMLIKSIGNTLSDVLEHQEMPLQHLTEDLGIPGAILSRAMFALQNVPNLRSQMGAVSIAPLDVEEGISNFDLSLSMRPQDDDLIAVLRYKTDLFQYVTMQQLLANFEQLLHVLVENPDQHLVDLPRFEITKVALATAPYVAPQTELETKIAAVWQQTLHVDRVGIHTNFFDLGGSSITMMHLCTELQKLSPEISIVELSKYNTINGMAQYLSQARGIEQIDSTVLRSRTQKQKDALKRRRQKSRSNFND